MAPGALFGEESLRSVARSRKFPMGHFGDERGKAVYFTAICDLENWIEPMQAKHRGNYYHRQFRRVPTIDECLVNDQLCMYEANEQMKRDKMIDKQIVKHLKIRFDECRRKYVDGAQTRCYQTYEDWNNTRQDFLVKWGDMPPQHNALDVYYKQVHRMIHERRQRENPEKK